MKLNQDAFDPSEIIRYEKLGIPEDTVILEWLFENGHAIATDRESLWEFMQQNQKEH